MDTTNEREERQRAPQARETTMLHPTSIRITYDLRRRLEIAAEANGRSISGEIVARLERAFKREAMGLDFSVGLPLKREKVVRRRPYKKG
jgi:hypothetical protein